MYFSVGVNYSTLRMRAYSKGRSCYKSFGVSQRIEGSCSMLINHIDP